MSIEWEHQITRLLYIKISRGLFRSNLLVIIMYVFTVYQTNSSVVKATLKLIFRIESIVLFISKQKIHLRVSVLGMCKPKHITQYSILDLQTCTTLLTAQPKF